MAQRTYFDFAEDDRNFLIDAYNEGFKRPGMAAWGQSVCERYLKHIISEYANPENADEQRDKEYALRTHSLRILRNYIEDNMGLTIPNDTRDIISRADGYYFATRYPGEDSFAATEEDVDIVCEAIEQTRNFVIEACQELEENEHNQEEPDGQNNTEEQNDEPDIYGDYDR